MKIKIDTLTREECKIIINALTGHTPSEEQSRTATSLATRIACSDVLICEYADEGKEVKQ